MNYFASLLITACLGPLLIRSACDVRDVEVETSPTSSYLATGLTELGQAAMENRPEDVARLVEKGCDINMGRYRYGSTEMRSTPLMLAAMYNNSEVVKELLKVPGVDVNLKSPGGKRSALFYAGKIGAIEVIKLLGQAGAEVNELDDEGYVPAFSPYIRLYWKNKALATETFKTIISLGADIDADGFPKNTLLSVVSRMADFEATEFMLCKGVDTEAENEEGLTALQLVRESERFPGSEEEREKIIEILENPPTPNSPQCQQSIGRELE